MAESTVPAFRERTASRKAADKAHNGAVKMPTGRKPRTDGRTSVPPSEHKDDHA